MIHRTIENSKVIIFDIEGSTRLANPQDLCAIEFRYFVKTQVSHNTNLLGVISRKVLFSFATLQKIQIRSRYNISSVAYIFSNHSWSRLIFRSRAGASMSEQRGAFLV